MREAGEGPAIAGEIPTFDQQFFCGLARDAVAKSAPAANEYLGRLTTLSAAFIGGGVVGIRADAMGRPFSLCFVVLLFACLGLCIGAIKPRRCEIDLTDPEACEAMIVGSLERRVRAASYGTILFVAAVATACAGVLLKAY